MIVPYSYRISIPITITKCEANGFGGTVVHVSVYDVALPEITIPDIVVGPAPGQFGYANIQSKVETDVTEMITDALTNSISGG